MKTSAVTNKTEEYHVQVNHHKVCTTCKSEYTWNDFYRTWRGGSAEANNGICSNCQFWVDNLMADNREGNGLIIEGVHYRTTTKDSGFNFGGQVFHILRKNVRKVEEVYLSHQGTVPVLFRKYPTFADNALFVEGIK